MDEEIQLSELEQRLLAAILEKIRHYVPGKEKQLQEDIANSLRMIVNK